MTDFIKTAQTSQIKNKSHLKDLQESVNFKTVKFDKYKKIGQKKKLYQKMI